MKNLILVIVLTFLITSCFKNEKKNDAYGNFEADEIIVSSQSNGMLEFLNIEEGQKLSKGIVVGVVDTVQLSLKREQLLIQKRIISSKRKNIAAQIEVIKQQKDNTVIEEEKYKRLVKNDAVPQKQLDEIVYQISVFDKQMQSISTQGISINDELKSLDIQIDQINDQIKKCYIMNPINGTVLTKYANKGEITAFSKPLYKIAGMSDIYLKVYVSGDELSKVILGGKAQVSTDAGNNTMKTVEGTVSWISDKAEFTPKIIQTKAERVNLVYAVKIKVKNDGSFKIGMPGEVNFTK
ncbi:MAG: efflux RND transporter periplasmic adaptor subunit [Candidatus Delongbacteria bacterium]|nr:efflux RND transporter periplasmic adaptor subunit [Candidatus Delongbacteria bacterium]MCG2761096.1 efflux RND transporter periplasmic adaptor subunit [Candidatus Delongbacteria bacterium]